MFIKPASLMQKRRVFVIVLMSLKTELATFGATFEKHVFIPKSVYIFGKPQPLTHLGDIVEVF